MSTEENKKNKEREKRTERVWEKKNSSMKCVRGTNKKAKREQQTQQMQNDNHG